MKIQYIENLQPLSIYPYPLESLIKNLSVLSQMSDITIVKDLFKLSIAGDAFLTPCSCTYSKLRRFWPRLFCLTRVYIEKHGDERQKVFFHFPSLLSCEWLNPELEISKLLHIKYIPILCIVNFKKLSAVDFLDGEAQRAGISKLFLSFFTNLYTKTCTTLCLSSITFLAVSYTPPH